MFTCFSLQGTLAGIHVDRGISSAAGRRGVSSAADRQRRAEWVEHVLQMTEIGDSSPAGDSTARSGPGTVHGHSTLPTHDNRVSIESSYEIHARLSMSDRARVREDERAVRERARCVSKLLYSGPSIFN